VFAAQRSGPGARATSLTLVIVTGLPWELGSCSCICSAFGSFAVCHLEGVFIFELFVSWRLRLGHDSRGSNVRPSARPRSISSTGTKDAKVSAALIQKKDQSEVSDIQCCEFAFQLQVRARHVVISDVHSYDAECKCFTKLSTALSFRFSGSFKHSCDYLSLLLVSWFSSPILFAHVLMTKIMFCPRSPAMLSIRLISKR